MLSNWTIKNFKSAEDRTKLEFAPLTIFAGANSSGKSTIIQSILLVTQTIQNSVGSKSVILNGHIIKLGSFNDILSNNSSENSITIEFTIVPEQGTSIFTKINSFILSPDEQIKKIQCAFSFSAEGDQKQKDILQLQPLLTEVSLKATYPDSGEGEEQKDYETETHIIRAKKSVKSRISEYGLEESKLTPIELNSLEYEVLKPKKSYQYNAVLYRPRREGDFIGSTLYHFLPANLSLLFDKKEEQRKMTLELLINPRHLEHYASSETFKGFNDIEVKNFVVKAIDEAVNEIPSTPKHDKPYDNFIKAKNKLAEEFNFNNLRECYKSPVYNRILSQKFEDKKEELKKIIYRDVSKESALDIQTYYDDNQFIESFFKGNVEYLGPLRDEPKPVYPLQGSADPKDIGFKGENTAAVLDIHKNLDIEYIKPENFESQEIKTTTTKATLLEAVLDWLSYMGIASAVQTADQGKLGHDMKITVEGSSALHDLTHVGVGVSQVLPILVLSLLAERDSTLIFEQPELHLNPRVQTRLGDFFASMVFLKKQCIVETHSEYLINRLRYLVAISEGDELSSKINIYFVEKENNKSIYNKVKINQYGTISEWPKGFFDENEKNAALVLQAGMNKKAKSHSRSKNG